MKLYKNKITVITLSLLIIFSSSYFCKGVNVNTRLSNAAGQFGLNLFKKLYFSREEKNKNIFISPISVFTALAMTYNGSRGVTYREFQKILNLRNLSKKSVNKLNYYLMQHLKSLNPDVKLHIANSLWVNQRLKLKQRFKYLSKKYFNALAKNVNFKNRSTVKIINKWIADKTNGLIKDMIDSLDHDTSMVLLNAIYFYGVWKHKFNKRLTKKRDFILADGGKIKHYFMNKGRRYYYGENNLFQIVKLNYGKKSKASLIILLPRKNKSLNQVVRYINTARLKYFIRKLKLQKVDLTIPKFKISYGTKSIKQVLQKLGLTRAFTNGANFRDMFVNRTVKIDDVLHKAVIDLNETGTRAAGATAVIAKPTSAYMGRTYRFLADRPFLYFIVDNKTNLPLFAGSLQKPVL